MSHHDDKGYAVFNPKGVCLDELPTIYGFNNGGSPGWYQAQLLAEDGTALGSHICSAECYMIYDLGIMVDSRPDRHETFQKHYPDGYRMDFVPFDHADLQEALKLNQEKQKQHDKLKRFIIMYGEHPTYPVKYNTVDSEGTIGWWLEHGRDHKRFFVGSNDPTPTSEKPFCVIDNEDRPKVDGPWPVVCEVDSFDFAVYLCNMLESAVSDS